MLPLQEISDRLEIGDLVARYSTFIDGRRWDELDALFTDDAVLDYTATGAIRGSLPELQAFFAEMLPAFLATQHLTGASTVVVDGDRATATTPCFNPMVVNEQQVFFVGLWYDDVLVRSPDGWRFAERTQRRAYVHEPARS
ncbi:MAG TPA: nuclear transport factor 2 family protein [Mycobacteriales bacterium]|nr:nuclear transport factor 2 family protein [Mycobacteriales bacterium]